MIYTPKWINDNLGITRDMIKNYEDNELIPKGANRNPRNNYREYTEKDLAKLWAIKTLISMEFTTAEIKAFMNNSCFDFYGLLSKKVVELEKKKKQYSEALDFAKTIKMTGRIPITTELGNMNFEEFVDHAKKEWNLYSDSQNSAFAEIAELLVEKPIEEWNSEEIQKNANSLEMLDMEMIMFLCNMNAYCNLIAELRYLEHTHEIVQNAVSLLYQCFEKEYKALNLEVPITPRLFSEYFSSSFVNGDTEILHERNYGKEGCVFISKAVVYFGEK